MSWLKLDDRSFDDQRFGAVSRDARLLHIEALAWSMAGDGTGAITRYGLRRATDADDPIALADELVAAGLWVATDPGYQLLFLLDDQMKPDEIERQRAFNRKRQERHRRHVLGDHSQCDPSRCNSLRNAGRNVVPNGPVTPPRPVPTRPEGTRGEDEARDRPASVATQIADDAVLGDLVGRRAVARAIRDARRAGNEDIAALQLRIFETVYGRYYRPGSAGDA